jgi:peptidoglycan/LPS O-acetylase OafA/YrhL
MGLKKRSNTIDLIRLVAAIGVIASHVPSNTSAAEMIHLPLFPLRVPFFYVIALTYFISSLRGASVRSIFKKFWWRLIVPFLSWSIIYTALLFTKNYLSGEAKTYELWRIFLYGESAVHMYFLPSLLIKQVLILGFFLLLRNTKRSFRLGIALLIFSLIYLVVGNIYNCYTFERDGEFIGILVFSLAALLLYPKIFDYNMKLNYIMVGLILIVFSVFTFLSGHFYTVLGYPIFFPLGGIGLLLLAMGFPVNTKNEWINKITSTSYGVYFSHILFLEAFQFFLAKFLAIEVHYNFIAKLSIIMGVFVCSSVFTLILKRIQIGKILLLGEGEIKVANHLLPILSRIYKKVPG